MGGPIRQDEIQNLADLMNALFGRPDNNPPEYWLESRVKLQSKERRVLGTIPAHMAEEAGVDRDDPGEVSVYYDPITDLICFDVSNRFEYDA